MTASDHLSVVESTNAPQGEDWPRARAVAPSSASIVPIARIIIPPQVNFPRASITAPTLFPRSPMKVIRLGCNPVLARKVPTGLRTDWARHLAQSVRVRNGCETLLGFAIFKITILFCHSLLSCFVTRSSLDPKRYYSNGGKPRCQGNMWFD